MKVLYLQSRAFFLKQQNKDHTRLLTGQLYYYDNVTKNQTSCHNVLVSAVLLTTLSPKSDLDPIPGTDIRVAVNVFSLAV
jgi:hypothetical protein